MDRQKLWREEKRRVLKIKDKLGRGIDKEIVETVTVLRLLGFNTIGSCKGHVRRVTTGPYVLIESPESAKFATRVRENKEDKKKYSYFSG